MKQEEVESQPKAMPSLQRQKAFKQKAMSIEAERPAKKAKQSSASSQCIILMPEVVEVEDEELKKVSRRKRFWVQQSWESQESKVSMGDGKRSKVQKLLRWEWETTSGKSGWREGAGMGAGRGVKAEVEVEEEEQVPEVFLKEDEQQQQQQQVVWSKTPEGGWEPVKDLGDVLQEVWEEQRCKEPWEEWVREQWEWEK